MSRDKDKGSVLQKEAESTYQLATKFAILRFNKMWKIPSIQI